MHQSIFRVREAVCRSVPGSAPAHEAAQARPLARTARSTRRAGSPHVEPGIRNPGYEDLLHRPPEPAAVTSLSAARPGSDHPRNGGQRHPWEQRIQDRRGLRSLQPLSASRPRPRRARSGNRRPRAPEFPLEPGGEGCSAPAPSSPRRAGRTGTSWPPCIRTCWAGLRTWPARRPGRKCCKPGARMSRSPHCSCIRPKRRPSPRRASTSSTSTGQPIPRA